VNTAFIDASAWVALYHKKDNHHERAWKVYEGLLDEGTKFLTSNWIAYEDKSVELFWKYHDKNWGIVDCSSILLMEQEKCSVAFGYDHHFVEAAKQYGFTVL
jgi:predicted nucleic acid-binding protein